ncbi:MAG: hypothetical protein ABI867_12975 [Kofleriaceae bacterium]
MKHLVIVMALAAPAVAAPAPKQCGASVNLRTAVVSAPIHIAGVVKAVTARRAAPNWFDVVVTEATGVRRFELFIAPTPPPFKAGEHIDVDIRRGGAFQIVYDAVFKDAQGKIVLVVSGSGASDWADGWKVTAGKVVESRQDPNHTNPSVNRTHALDFTRNKTTVTVLPHTCTVVLDGADRFIASGFASTWLGERPPEGVDYQTFAMIRWK